MKRITHASKVLVLLTSLFATSQSLADVEATCSVKELHLTTAADGFTPVYGVKLDCPITNSFRDFDGREHNAFVWETDLERAKELKQLLETDAKACISLSSTYFGSIENVDAAACECQSDDMSVECN